MKKILPLLLTITLLTINCFAQTAPVIQWQNTIGGDRTDYLYSIEQAIDGGYILGGISYSNISGDKTENNIDPTFSTTTYDYWIVKIDSSGNVQWDNTIGGTNEDRLCSVQHTTDGGYIVGGFSNSDSSGDKTENSWNSVNDYWIVKTDSLGNILWQNTIGGNQYDALCYIQQTSDGGYILGGSSASDSSGDKVENSWNNSFDYWIVKTDSIGNIQWQNTIGGTQNEDLYSIKQTADGGYILGGLSNSNISGDKTENNNDTSLVMSTHDYWIVKADSLGNIQWQNTIGGNKDDFLHSINLTSDGGYILGGSSYSNISGDKTENNLDTTLLTSDYWIIKIDSIGNIQWQNTIGGNDDDGLLSVQQTNDGGYILGGSSSSNISGDKTENNLGYGDYWVVKTDSAGNILWQNTIGGIYGDGYSMALQTSDGGYFVGGTSNSNISGDKTEISNGWFDYCIVKLAPDTITGINNIPTNTSFSVYPNPFSEEMMVSCLPVYRFPVELKMNNVFGKEIISQTITTVNSKLKTTNLSPGVYFVKVNNEIKKVVKID